MSWGAQPPEICKLPGENENGAYFFFLKSEYLQLGIQR